MPERVTIDDRGAVRIPAVFRSVFGLEAGSEVIAEVAPDGILLRPAVPLPIEVYSDERIAEFENDEHAIAEILNHRSPD